LDSIPETSRAVVYDPKTGALDVRSFAVRPPRPDEILVRVSLSAICGSDLHTISGRRRPRGPLILGHEICGMVARLGAGVVRDSAGVVLSAGDRVTWSIAASCGSCFSCTHGIPQKCESLFKYGHESIDVDPPLNGGFAEYVYLAPGTAVFRIPDELNDETAVFANCSLATMVAAVRSADIRAGESVLIQGAGLVGLCAAALCAARRCRIVMVADTSSARLERAKAFGATHVVNPGVGDETFRDVVARTLGDQPDSRAPHGRPLGFDAAIEACGSPEAIPIGIQSLRIGGRYVVAGCVFPGALVTIDFHTVITRLIRIMGLHNYTPEDLRGAIEFLVGAGRNVPFNSVVQRCFRLEEISRALKSIEQHKDFLRVALRP